MSDRNAAGYSGSSLTTNCFWVTMLSGGESWASGEEEVPGVGDREARSLSPAASSLVTLQNNSSPENTQVLVTKQKFVFCCCLGIIKSSSLVW